MDSWAGLVVDRLAALKLTGMNYDAAWTLAMKEYPPRLRDRGPAQPLLFGGMEEESLEDFFCRACRDAWYGERPELEHLATALADVGHREARPLVAGKSRPAPMAAAA